MRLALYCSLYTTLQPPVRTPRMAAFKDLKFFTINFEMDQFHLIVGVGNVLAAILCNIITIKFIFTKYEVVFIGTAVGVITFFWNLHRIMRRPTFFFTDKVSM